MSLLFTMDIDSFNFMGTIICCGYLSVSVFVFVFIYFVLVLYLTYDIR